jgi:hypothetical protein
MSARPESRFPTIRDLRDALNRLVDGGLGDLAVQVVIAPDSTMQAIARVAGGPTYDAKKPAIMIELDGPDGSGRLPPSIVSTERMSSSQLATQ